MSGVNEEESMNKNPVDRSISRSFAAGAMLALTAVPAWAADNYPTRPVRMIVGFPPAGANDLVARVVAARLGPRLGQQVVVENRPGASGNIATELVAKAPPDGYTILLGSVSSLGMAPALYGQVPFDPIADFAPVTQLVGVSALLVAHPTLPARSLKEYVALAKKHPGKLNLATPGTGSVSHLAAELFLMVAGVKVVHVPYKGGGPAVIDALSGQVESMMSLISTGAPHVKSGRLRGLGISSARRSPILPEVPTIAEGGYPGYEASGWLGLLAPAKTPDAVVQRLYRETTAVLKLAEVSKQLEANGLDPAPSDPQAFHAYMKAELAKWTKVIRTAGLRAN
jgi:tripartite-type tricarboxylate transporter receptor subunit TctC